MQLLKNKIPTLARAQLSENMLAGALDNADTVIANQRDLEDFTRLHLKLEAVSMSQLQQGTLTLRLEWRSVTGTPSLRVYRAYETSGTNRYLFDTAIAASQLAGGFGNALGTVASGSSLVLPAPVWTGASGSNVFRPFLFEGVSAGQGQLWAVLVNASGAVAESTPVFLKLAGVTNLFEHFTAGDTNTMDWNMIPGNYLRTYDSGSPATDATRDYILLVHGWRMQPWERRAFAATAFKRLYWQGYRGGFGLFSWPTDWTGTTFWDMFSQANRQNYDRSERRAWLSAIALRRLLLNLNRQYPGSVRLLSHSMGGVVGSEALRIHGSRSGTAPMVHTYIAAQPASVAHAYDAVTPEVVRSGVIIRSGMIAPEVYAAFPRTNGPQRYYMGMANAVNIDPLTLRRATWNYHNFEDYALNTTQAWPLNQALKPDFGWDYAGVWWRGAFFGTRLKLSTDVYEIFAHIAIARSKALGCSEDAAHLVRGEIGNAFDLNSSTTGFGFKAGQHEHSAEFNSVIQRRWAFWRQTLDTMQTPRNP